MTADTRCAAFCGTEVPAELLFTPAELEHLRRKEAESEECQRQQRAKEAAEAEAQARAQSGGVDTFFPPGF